MSSRVVRATAVAMFGFRRCVRFFSADAAADTLNFGRFNGLLSWTAPCSIPPHRYTSDILRGSTRLASQLLLAKVCEERCQFYNWNSGLSEVEDFDATLVKLGDVLQCELSCRKELRYFSTLPCPGKA